MGKKEDIVECPYCGMIADYDKSTIYYCELCGKFFCKECFEKLVGKEEWIENFGESQILLCPQCWQKRRGTKIYKMPAYR